MRYVQVSHICIFPSDGTNRIRFTGKGYRAHSQPDASGPPKTYVLRDTFIILSSRRPSSGADKKIRFARRRCKTASTVIEWGKRSRRPERGAAAPT